MRTDGARAGGGRLRQARGDPRSDRGQMTVELAAVFPVAIVVAVIAVNALTFLSECAAFDVALREAARVHAASPAYGQGLDQSTALIEAGLREAFPAENESVTVQVESVSGGHARFSGTLEFHPTLFGLGLRSSVFGVSLPPLRHAAQTTVDPYKPGAIL